MRKVRAKTSSTFASARLIWSFLEGSRRYFLFGVLLTLAVALMDFVNPKIIGYAVDALAGEGSNLEATAVGRMLLRLGGMPYIRSHPGQVALMTLGTALVCALCRYLFRLFNSMGSEGFLRTMRDRLYEQLLHLPYAWHKAGQTGDIIQRCTSDVETVRRFVSDQIPNFFRIVVMMAMALWFMAGLQPRLTLAASAYFPVIILYSVIFRRRISGAFQRADEEEGRLSAIAQENLTGVRVVRAFGRESYERERFEKKNAEYTMLWVRLMRILNLFWCTGDLISGLQLLTVLALGSSFCVRGLMTAGDFVAFVAYNAMLLWPVRELGRVISEMSKAGIAIGRIRFIMDAERERDREGAQKPDMRGEIRFDRVTFRYPGSEEEALTDVSFRIRPGQTIGILGGTGSGKSTLMDLLVRLYELEEDCGQITVGGVDVRDIQADWLRSHIGFVLQEPFLFSRTLGENITIAAPDTAPRRLREAARSAALEETIERFAAGYDTPVGERGVTLSGGQKQRTAIAQMLIRKPPIMIFDDSLSAVDTQTDEKIRAALRTDTRDATVILISHRITTLMSADEILVMDRGRVVQHGTHAELLQADGRYRKVYDLQTAGLDARGR